MSVSQTVSENRVLFLLDVDSQVFNVVACVFSCLTPPSPLLDADLPSELIRAVIKRFIVSL